MAAKPAGLELVREVDLPSVIDPSFVHQVPHTVREVIVTDHPVVDHVAQLSRTPLDVRQEGVTVEASLSGFLRCDIDGSGVLADTCGESA